MQDYPSPSFCVINLVYSFFGRERPVFASKPTRRSDNLRGHLQAGFIPVLIFVVSLFFFSPVCAFSPEEDLTARGVVLMDATTGKVLYQKEPDLRLPPASTTKVVTAIVALESGRNLTELLTVSKTATRVPASKLYLRPGQTISIEDLLYSVLLSSANDASIVLAEGISGSVEQYAELMIKKAHDIGAINSYFTNPHGLTAQDHYSTARDLAIIFRYAMKNPTFREIIQTKISSVQSFSKIKKKTRSRRVSVRNHNRLLWNFNGALGGKTGYTHAAQKCFVGAVTRDGVTLIVSILGARNLWSDTRNLLEYGFENYQALKTASSKDRLLPVSGQVAIRQEKLGTVVVTPQEEKIKAARGYVLQVASFRERERAESLRKRISEQGFEAFLETTALSEGETTYRVRVGPYPELLEAQATAHQIENKSGFRAIILPAQPPGS